MMFKSRFFMLLCVAALLLSMTSCSNPDEVVKEEPSVGQTNESHEEDAKDSTVEEDEADTVVTEKNEEPEEPEENNKPEETESDEIETDEKPDVSEKTEEKPSESTDDQENSGNSENAISDWDSSKLTAAEIEALLNDPYMILVNRQNKVSSDYEPMNLTNYAGERLNKTCADALKRMINDGKKAGYDYVLYSGYRTYNTQYNKYYNKIAYYKNQGYSEEKAIELTDQYYAQPGASEHHTGLAADVCIPRIVNKYACLHEAYGETPEFEWFSTHAHEYGFILRYGETQTEITGYNYEPWHYRYVGVDVATEIYRRGITYEEFIQGLQNRLEELKK